MEADNRDEGPRLAQVAAKAGLPLKLFGGVAAWVLCPSARLPQLRRDYADIDFATTSGRTKQVTAFMAAEGYEADKLFNALHGATRLAFSDGAGGRSIDVIVDRFIECHTIDLRDALKQPGTTIPLPELLLTKLQVVEINDKDLRDILALMLDHGPGGAAGESLDAERVAAIASGDWGLEHTIRRTLARIEDDGGHLGLDRAQVETVRAGVAAIVAALDRAPKSLRWRSRALVGERVRWYQLPEEPRR